MSNRQPAMMTLGTLWVMIGVTWLYAVAPPRPELIDVPDWARATAWITAGVLACLTSNTNRGSRWALVGMSLTALERVLSLGWAWLGGSGDDAPTKDLVYMVAAYAVYLAASLPAGGRQ